MPKKQPYPLTLMFTSRDMRKSLAFYRDTLGFELEGAWPDETNPMWANVMLDGQSIMLGATMSPEAADSMCGGDAGAAAYMKTLAEEFKKHKPGVGVLTYVMVSDVDAYHAKLVKKGVRGLAQPKSQFYGIRDFGLEDPDGYRLMIYTNIKLDNCQSCGMPLTDAQPGQMYCEYCLDEKGTLKPYEQVFEGCVQGYFMGMQKMKRNEAETAAKAHLKQMPAWAGRK
jgi:uncharacterized glyoxalase superfamily protein PhnB